LDEAFFMFLLGLVHIYTYLAVTLKPDKMRGIKKDKVGNELHIVKKGIYLTLYLRLKTENRMRKLGRINTSRKIFYINRTREKHLFRKLNAYGLSYEVIKEAKTFDQIRLKDEYSEWLIPKEWILETDNKEFLNFQNSGGFELQAFLTLEAIKQFKTQDR